MRKKCLRLLAGVLALAVMMTYTISWNLGEAKTKKNKDVKKVEITNVQGKKITLGKGKKLQLSVNVILKQGSKASKAVKFTSSNKSVVKVSKKGVLKAKKLGKAKITVKSKANPSKKAVVVVTVAKKNVLITKISMKKNLTLHMPLIEDDDEDDGSDDATEADDSDDEDDEDEDDEDDEEDDEEEEDYEFSPRITPSNATKQNLKWSSSNKKVVKVDEDGCVYIVDAGKAVITASATDGSGKKAKCSVTVIDDAAEDDDEDE